MVMSEVMAGSSEWCSVSIKLFLIVSDYTVRITTVYTTTSSAQNVIVESEIRW